MKWNRVTSHFLASTHEGVVNVWDDRVSYLVIQSCYRFHTSNRVFVSIARSQYPHCFGFYLFIVMLRRLSQNPSRALLSINAHYNKITSLDWSYRRETEFITCAVLDNDFLVKVHQRSGVMPQMQRSRLVHFLRRGPVLVHHACDEREQRQDVAVHQMRAACHAGQIHGMYSGLTRPEFIAALHVPPSTHSMQLYSHTVASVPRGMNMFPKRFISSVAYLRRHRHGEFSRYHHAAD